METVGKALKMLLWMTFITGVIYPMLITVIAFFSMPKMANGSIELVDGKPVGSSLIGQEFKDAKYFWSRPSAVGYNPLASGGSNLAPSSLELQKIVKERRAQIMASSENEGVAAIPSELLYASGSGLDPHISPVAAIYQLRRIIKARGLSESEALALQLYIEKLSFSYSMHIFGKPVVNVLELNQFLDGLK